MLGSRDSGQGQFLGRRGRRESRAQREELVFKSRRYILFPREKGTMWEGRQGNVLKGVKSISFLWLLHFSVSCQVRSLAERKGHAWSSQLSQTAHPKAYQLEGCPEVGEK